MRRKSSFSYANGNCLELEDGWRKATRCDANSCVEVAVIPAVAVRDTKNQEKGPVLTFTRGQWKTFTSRVKALS